MPITFLSAGSKCIWGRTQCFKRVPITVLSARPNVQEFLEQSTSSMKSSCIQQGLDGRYSAQANLIGFFYLFDIFIGRAFHQFQLLLHLQCLASLDVSLLFKGLDHLRQLTFFLLSLGQGLFYLFKFCQQGFLSLPIDRRSFASAYLLRISECRCSYVFHRQGALLSLPPLKARRKQLYRQGAVWPFVTGAIDLQVSSLEENLLGIDRNLASESLE